MARVIINLREQERSALHALAQREYRTPKDLAAVIIRKELERQGVLEPPAPLHIRKEEQPHEQRAS